jgi:hypothetical protein
MSEAMRAEMEREDEERRHQFYLDNHTESHAYQVVNLLWKGGKVTETWFLVKRKINCGKWTDCSVENSFGDIIGSRTAEDGEELSNRDLHFLKRAVEERLRKEEQRGAVIEVVQDWKKAHDHDFYPARARTRKFYDPNSRTWGDTEVVIVRPPTRQERRMIAEAERMRAQAKKIALAVETIRHTKSEEEKCRLIEALLDFPGKSRGLEDEVFAILKSQNQSEGVKDCAARVLKKLIAR